MPIVRFEMKGQRELLAKLRGMDRKMQRSIGGKVVRAGCKVIVTALKAAAPRDTGRGAKSIGTKFKTYRNGRVTVGISGERVQGRRDREKGKKSKWGAPHFHLIEYGTGERFHTGEKSARQTAKRLRPYQGERSIRRLLTATGTFGKHSAPAWNRKGQLRFARTLRDVQAKIKRGQRLRRSERAVAVDLARGRRTGRVQPHPFFERIWRSVVGRVQSVQAAVLRREIESAAKAA